MSLSKKWKIISSISIVLGVGVASGAISTGIYFALNKKDTGYINKNAKLKAYSSKIKGNDREILVELYHGETLVDGLPLDQKHLNKFSNIINKFRYYGPEFNEIKRIAINDNRLVSSSENGVYFPSTHEIGLNTKNIEQKIASKLKGLKASFEIGDAGFYSDEVQNIIVDELTEVFYHEYGHHIMNEYSSNVYRKNNASQGTYEQLNDGSRDKTYFNKAFLDSFEDIFGYDDISENINFGKSIYPSGNKAIPIQDYATLWNLYENANGKTDALANVPKQVYVFSEDKKTKADPIKSLLPSGREVVDDKNLNYLYSIDELLTRKMLLSSMPQTSGLINIINGKAIKDVIWSRGYQIQDPLNYFERMYTNTTSDLAKYDIPMLRPDSRGNLNIIKINDDYSHNNYYVDDPFLNSVNDNAKKYMELIAKSTGSMQGFNLSYINHYNNYKIMISEGSLYGDPKPEDLDKIIFGGYISTQNKRSHVGYKKEGKIHEISQIEFNDGEGQGGRGFFYKENLLSDKDHTEGTSTNTAYWVTKNYTDANNYDGLPLYLFNKSENGEIIDSIPLTSFRGEVKDPNNITEDELIAGMATSQRDIDPYDRAGLLDHVWTGSSAGIGVSINKVELIGGDKNVS